jgi:uncharacterized protein with PQ loop repeat
MPIASIVGWGGGLVGTLTVIAQAARVRRVGADGVNATTWSLFTLMSAFWLAYGVATSSIEIVAASLAGVPFLVWLLCMLDWAERRRGLGRAAVAVAVTTWLPAALLGWNAGLLGIGVLVVATRLPQLAQLIRAHHARGVSTGSWLLGATSVAMWLTYYVATSRTAAAVTMGAALLTNVSIVAMAYARHRTTRCAPALRPVALATA